MKHPLLQCYKKCSLEYLIMFLTFILEVWGVPLLLVSSVILNVLGLFTLIFVIVIQIRLSADLNDKCFDIIQATLKPSGLYYADGKPQMYRTDYMLMGVTLLVIPAIIIGSISIVMLLAV